MSKKVETRTMANVLAELNASVDAYNAATDAERAELTLTHKKLVQEFNELSLLSAYAGFMREDNPLVALAKTYYYDTVSVKDAVHNEVIDGVMTSNVTRSVKDGKKKFDVVKFIEWTEEHNRSVAAARDWKAKVLVARNSIETEWKKFFSGKGETAKLSVGKTKKVLQEMFDALVFIAGETGKNAFIADGKIARFMIGFANSRKDSAVDGNVTITGNVLPRSTWQALLLDIMHMAATGKTYEVIYGEPEEATDADADADSEETEEATA